MTDLLFSTPWWLPTLICGIGIVLFITANNRQETRLRNSAIGIFVLGLLVALVSYYVETPKEKVDRHTHELVTAVVADNWKMARSLLDPQITFARLHGPDQIIAAMQAAQNQVQVKSAHIMSMRTDASPNDISVNIDVLTNQEATMDRPIMSGWRLDWVPTPDRRDWKLALIECLGSGQITADQIESHIPGVK